MKSFAALQAEYHLHHTQFFSYLQLRHALHPYLAQLEMVPEHNPLEAKILLTNLEAHKISNIYKSLIIHTPDNFEQLRAAWNKDLPQFTEEDWTEALMSPKEAVTVSQFKLIQLKYLHRIYYT